MEKAIYDISVERKTEISITGPVVKVPSEKKEREEALRAFDAHASEKFGFSPERIWRETKESNPKFLNSISKLNRRIEKNVNFFQRISL